MANKVLVAVFSAGGVTRKVGKEIANICDGSYFEIIPEEKYTKGDLNWMNKRSRSSLEMKDPSARPAIALKLVNMDEFDTIILGYPIWWGLAPRIIETFLESYDMEGKTIIPFCTSGGSGMGNSDVELHKNVSGNVKWKKGVQINRPNEKAIRSWLEEVLD